MAAGETVAFKVGFAGAAGGTTTDALLNFARMFGVAEPGRPGYSPEVARGRQVDTYLAWTLDGEGRGVVATVPRADMPGYLPTIVEGLNDNWSVHVLDRAREGWNHRGLPVRDGLSPRILLIRLPGHTPGHCGVAVETGDGWLLHCGDAASSFYPGADPNYPHQARANRLSRRLIGTQVPRLRALVRDHGHQVRLISGHDIASWQALREGF